MNTVAYLNHGRWVVDCPRDGCPESRLATPGVFICTNCHQIATVEIPPERAAVDAAVAARPVPQTRNWYPGETVEQLYEENETHGVVNT